MVTQQSNVQPTQLFSRVILLGQQGHGKTTLVSALARAFGRLAPLEILNRPSSEWEGAICYSAAHVEIEQDSQSYDYLDAPSHFDIVKLLLGNQWPVDSAILVVSAVEGVQAETRAQIKLAHETQVSISGVVLTKLDLVQDTELLPIIEDEIRMLLQLYQFPHETIPIFHGSALAVLQSHTGFSQNDPSTHWLRELVRAVDCCVLSSPDGKQVTSILEPDKTLRTIYASIYVLADQERQQKTMLGNGDACQCYLHNAWMPAIIHVSEDIGWILPNMMADIIIELQSPVSLEKGLRINIAPPKTVYTVALGVCTDITP